MIMFAASLASRGLGNKKTDLPTKQLRVVSCFGGIENIPPCPYLMESKVDSTKHFCGRCGCGDKKMTWLVAKSEDYSKLDYPLLNCPLHMPGFTNYDPNLSFSEATERKNAIEQLDPMQLQFVQVTIGSSEEKEHIISTVNKIIKNS